jgi:putative SOS response-associated peptidase YedK
VNNGFDGGDPREAVMCARFTLSTPPDVVAELFGLPDISDLPSRYNIAPSQPVACVRGDRRGRWLDMLRWGLIPSWATDPKIAHSLINARAETVAEKPAFRTAFRHRRCLIPADGFYGWQQIGPEKQAYHFRMHDESVFALAGLWEAWPGPDRTTVETCTILTTAANWLVARASDRMPVIIDREHFGRWLEPSTEPPALARLLRPYPADAMTATPVGSLVNSVRNEGPTLLAGV